MNVRKSNAVRVLIVDDEPADAEVAKRLLLGGGRADFEVRCVEYGSEAIYCLHHGRFDVLLLTLGLPGYSDLEALQEIRRENREIPVVVLTAISDECLALKAIDQGAQDYLAKDTLTADSLVRSIRYAIQRQQLLATTIEREQAIRQAEVRKSAMLESALDAIISVDHEGSIVEFNPAAARMFGYSRAKMIGRQLHTVILPPPHGEGHRHGLASYLTIGNKRMLDQRMELVAIGADGAEFPIELAFARVPIAGPPTFTAFIRDLSERKRHEEELDERVRLATLVARVGVILTRADDLQSTLQECTQALVEELDVAFARIWTLNSLENVLELQASAGMYTHLDGPHSRVPVGHLKIGLIAAERKPHLTNQVIGDTRVGDQEWAQREGMVAFAGYPLIVDDRLVGVMAVFARRILPSATLAALAAVVDHIATGIERKRAEQSLQFTKFTIDHVATSVLWSDANGRFFNVNDAACSLTGYTREELLALCISDVDINIPHSIWPAVWNEMQQRRSFVTESILQRKDGSTIPISVNSSLLQTDDREFICAFLQDITDRKEAEQVQQQSELRFRAVHNQLQLQIERMPLAYILLDADFRVIDWNPAAERIFGYRKDEVLGMSPPFEKLVPADSMQAAPAILDRIRAGDISGHSVNDNLTKYGRTITCEWMNTRLTDEQEQFSGLMCLAHDITERNRLEEQFRQAQKMEAVGSLAGGVAHEFNNLLQTICGYTKFAMEDASADTQQHQDLQIVLKSANQAVVLTKQLLSFGRRQMLQRAVVDPNQIVAELVKMLRPLIGENIEVELHLVPAVSSIYVDAGQLQQVLLNLCINARDVMPDGGRLILRTQNVTLSEKFCADHHGKKPGPHVLLSVAGTGSGMSAEVKARIFEPFFTTKAPGKGTGLGLSMVAGMVEQHAGIIHVYSEPGAGTTFKIYLPAARSSELQSPEQSLSPKSAGGKETILIAEDDPQVLQYLVRVLSGAGYHVLATKNGMEGLRMFQENSETISLAILDVVMPLMGGRELFERLRAANPHIRVIFCSGHDPQIHQAELIAEQGSPTLQKPVDANTLLLAVREVLDTPNGTLEPVPRS